MTKVNVMKTLYKKKNRRHFYYCYKNTLSLDIRIIVIGSFTDGSFFQENSTAHFDFSIFSRL